MGVVCAGEQNACRAARSIDDMLPVIIGLLVAIVVAILFGEFRWSAGTRALRVRLESARLPIRPKVVGASLFSGDTTTLAGLGESREFPQFSALGFLVYNIVSFGFGEETGWRGFAPPRLQVRHSTLIASMLLTVGWALWHLPLFLYRPGYTSMDAAGIAGWLFSLMTGAVLLTWLYNESRGSILVVAIFHATVDVALTSSIASSSVVNVTGALITLWGIIVLVVAGPRYLSKHGKVVSRATEFGAAGR